MSYVAIQGKPEFNRKIKMPIEIAAGFWVWVIGESITDTLPISTLISFDIFTFGVIQKNGVRLTTTH